MTSPSELESSLDAMRAELEQLRAEVARWQARYAKGDRRDLAWTNSAREVAPLYTALDLEGSGGTAFEVPGEFPFAFGRCAGRPPPCKILHQPVCNLSDPKG